MTARLHRLRRIFLGKILEEIYGVAPSSKYFGKKERQNFGEKLRKFFEKFSEKLASKKARG